MPSEERNASASASDPKCSIVVQTRLLSHCEARISPSSQLNEGNTNRALSGHIFFKSVGDILVVAHAGVLHLEINAS